MKKNLVLYNPTAGDGSHSEESLGKLLAIPGTELRIISTDETGWESALDKPADLLTIAGGDGTVNKVAIEVLKNKMDIPMRILPLGTANNISKALNRIELHSNKYVPGQIAFDVGRLSGLPDTKFFVESIGIGAFPRFMKEISDKNNKDTLKIKYKPLIQYFIKTIEGYKPAKTVIRADGLKLKGKFLLVEIFNINYLGPNMNLAPASTPDDGLFDLGVIPLKRKGQFSDYLTGLADGKPDQDMLEELFLRFKAKKIKIATRERYLHVDDEIIREFSGGSIKVKLSAGRLNFNVQSEQDE